MLFKIDDKVVYPSQGVASVEEVVEKKVSGSSILFYKLSFLYKDMTILIPVRNSESTGVRTLSSPELITSELDKLMAAVSEKKRIDVDVSPSGWNKRHKDYQQRLQRGDFPTELGIYQELMLIAQQKDLSFGEKGLLQTAEELLLQEMMLVLMTDRTSALQMLRAPFKQFVVSYSPSATQGTL